MKQNIYDDESFFYPYLNLRKKSLGLNDVLEIPAFRSLLPDLTGKEILDLGCGFGQACKWYVAQGAKNVVGIDISHKIINIAKKEFCDDRIIYECIPMEDVNFTNEKFDLVFSSLAFHYIADYNTLTKKISTWLKPDGFFNFFTGAPTCNSKKGAYGLVLDC